MPASLFTATVIAVIWDFDQTLIPGYQQDPLFAEYGIDANEFWSEVGALEGHYKRQGLEVTQETLYLNHILTYVKEGHMKGLTNKKLQALGSKLDFYPGIPDFLDLARKHISNDPRFSPQGITVEHYVVSTGLRQMILGSRIRPHVDGVWASEFIEDPAGRGFLKSPGKLALEEHQVTQVGYFLDNTSKTRAVFEINKGSNVVAEIGVNDTIAPEDRRVPFRNMIYVADGPSDIPVFSVLNSMGGRTLGVYNPGQVRHFRNVKTLQDQGRVQHFTEADYRPDTNAAQWILASLEDIALAIVRDREKLLKERVHHSVGHVT
jgi:hypothetical protein